MSSPSVARTLAEQEAAAARVRPVPADFAANAAILTERGLYKHYRTSQRVVHRWLAETGLEPLHGTRFGARPVPDDFAEKAARLCAFRLCALYDCSDDAIKRWSSLTGIVPPKGVPGRRRLIVAVRSAKVVRPAAHRSFAGPKSSFTGSLRRDASAEGLAADHLRKWQPVYRCTERGGVPEQALSNDPRLTHWRCGSAVLSGAELVDRAVRKGFDPEAWKRLAA